MTSEAAGQRILIVDDTPENIDVLGEVLSHYRCSFALSGAAALKKVLAADPPDLILLDIVMPGMDGYEVCRQLKSSPQTEDIPIIFITAMSDAEDETFGLELGAVDYITKPINASIVRGRVNTQLKLKLAQEALKNQNELLEQKVRERTMELEKTKDATILSLASLAETRDNETGNHIKRTRDYVQLLAESLQRHGDHGKSLDNESIRLIYKSAVLHDIGKVGVRDCILLKPGKLTEDEFAEMKHHPGYGRNTLEAAERELGENDFLRCAREIAYTHHEHWDGTGYPQGLRGEEIPLPGRLMAIADIYDALISKRIYKPAFTHARAVEIMTQGDGRTQSEHFDPVLLQIFSRSHEAFRLIALKYADVDCENDVVSKDVVTDNVSEGKPLG